MRPTVLFVHVVGKPEYRHGEQRLLDSYRKYLPQIPHDVAVIDRGPSDDMYDCIGALHYEYTGGGWDCGAWQWASRNIESELLCCFNSSCYITGPGWLRRFVDAVQEHGDGLYGPLTSFEIVPHVRTPCMIFQPHVIKGYPREVQNRDDTYRFESMGWPDRTPNVTQWVRGKGYKTPLVTWDGVYDQPDWRKPPNIFRRGTQNNLIVKDRHCDAYAASDAAGKAMLEKLADGR